ncbi:hypothetical protein ACFXPX_17455 [Kitasatospora sp. NPDC059146]|uniref:hypothetical protein n=1 Tax=Kitasatospora sp. NPDC059146 TaxID=3346741 RepID=UPI0036ABB84F
MGTDTRGFVECRTWAPGLDPGERAWQAAVDLSLLGPTRDYGSFACLFGVRDPHRHWRPVVGARGLPADASATTRAGHASWGPAAFGATWLGWDEVLAVDWDEPALPRATRIARYRRRPDGSLEPVRREDWSRAFARAAGIDSRTFDFGRLGEHWAEGTEWDTGPLLFRAERDRRRDAVPADGPWRPVWTVLRTLAEVHGEQHVRLVVWFEE